MSLTTSLPFAIFNGVPVIRIKETLWKVKTAFTGATVGDIVFKCDFESFFNTSDGGTEIKPYYTYYWNVNTKQELADNAVDLANLTFIQDTTAGAGSSVVTNVTLNNATVAGNTTANYSNVKSAIVAGTGNLLNPLLPSTVNINGATFPTNVPIIVPIPSGSKLTNNLVINPVNIAVSVLYTT